MPVTRVVAITGCDSGLGWALAARSAREGIVTVAGMLKGTNTEAAQTLDKLCAHPFPLDVTKPESVAKFRDYVQKLLKDNPNFKLYALVNNAGVMTIGDYEWMTPSMIENMINVNLLGSMRVASAFLPDLRRSALDSNVKPRLINVTSHCGLHPLPGFAAYSASKAGVLAWTKALRHEQSPYGLKVVAFVPGGFVASSNIMANQISNGRKMIENLNDEQKSFYGNKIEALNNYLGTAPNNSRFDSVKDENIIETFMKALNADCPKELYKVEPWRYKVYYTLMRLPLPEIIMNWLIQRFLSFPKV